MASAPPKTNNNGEATPFIAPPAATAAPSVPLPLTISTSHTLIGVAKVGAIVINGALCLLLIFLLIYYVAIFPNPCLKLVDDPEVPFGVGVDLKNARVFLILNRPFPTGSFKSPTTICGKAPTIDTNILPALGELHLNSANITLKLETCGNDDDDGDSMLKFIFANNSSTSNLQITDLSVRFIAEDTSSSDNETKKFVQISSQNGTIAARSSKSVAVEFLRETVLKFTPAVGVTYSELMILLTSEVLLLPANSTANQCGAPVVGVKFDATVLDNLGQAVSYLIRNGWQIVKQKAENVGLTQFFLVTVAQISEFTAKTQPIAVDLKLKKKRDIADETINTSGVFILSKSLIKIDQTHMKVSNLTLTVGDQVRLQCFVELGATVSHASVKGVAKLRQQSPINLAFRDARFSCPLDIDLSLTANSSTSLQRRQNDQLGSFSMKNLSVLSLADNSSLSAAAFSGNLETVFIRSFKSFVDNVLVQYIFLFDFSVMNMHGVKGEPMKVNFGGAPSPGGNNAPLAIQVYRIGKVSNSMKIGLSFSNSNHEADASGYDQVRPIAMSLLAASPSKHQQLSASTPLHPALGMELHDWELKIADVRVGASFPLKSRFKIDSLTLRLDSTSSLLALQNETNEDDSLLDKLKLF